jgi:hypothetical protein
MEGVNGGRGLVSHGSDVSRRAAPGNGAKPLLP